MKAVVAAFNQEKALVGAFSVITNLRMELFEALLDIVPDNNPQHWHTGRGTFCSHVKASSDIRIKWGSATIYVQVASGLQWVAVIPASTEPSQPSQQIAYAYNIFAAIHQIIIR